MKFDLLIFFHGTCLFWHRGKVARHPKLMQIPFDFLFFKMFSVWVSYNFISVALLNLPEQRIYLAYHSSFSLYWGKLKAGAQVASHITPTVQSREKQIHPYCLPIFVDPFPVLYSLGTFWGNGATHNGLGLPTSISNQDNYQDQPDLDKSSERLFSEVTLDGGE